MMLIQLLQAITSFMDYELQSKHERVGAGLELLSSIFEFRANAYQAVSKTLTYNGIQENCS